MVSMAHAVCSSGCGAECRDGIMSLLSSRREFSHLLLKYLLQVQKPWREASSPAGAGTYTGPLGGLAKPYKPIRPSEDSQPPRKLKASPFSGLKVLRISYKLAPATYKVVCLEENRYRALQAQAVLRRQPIKEEHEAKDKRDYRPWGGRGRIERSAAAPVCPTESHHIACKLWD